MAAKLADGFDYYTLAKMSRKWDYIYANVLGPSLTYGRRGTQGVLCKGLFQTIGSGAIGRNLPAANASWGYFGTYVNIPALPSSGYIVIHSVYDLAASGGMKLCTLVGADGRLAIGYITVNNLSTIVNILASSATGLINSGVGVYLESGFKINSTVGGAILKIAGQTSSDAAYVAYTGNTVRSSGSNYHADSLSQQMTHVRIGGGADGGQDISMYIDDFYYCDDTGTRNNTFLGNLGYDTIYSNALGDISDWARTGAASDILAVNEHPTQDDDAGYLSSPTVGEQFIHNLDGVASTAGRVAFAAVNHVIKQDDTGTRQVKALLKAGGVLETGATPYTTPGAYSNRQTIFETSPATLTNLTLAEVAALQTGAEVTT